MFSRFLVFEKILGLLSRERFEKISLARFKIRFSFFFIKGWTRKKCEGWLENSRRFKISVFFSFFFLRLFDEENFDRGLFIERF